MLARPDQGNINGSRLVGASLDVSRLRRTDRRGQCLQDRDFGGQHGTGGNDARHAAIAVGEMRRDFQPARPADAHAVHAVEEPADQRAAIDADLCDQRLAVVLEPRGRRPGPMRSASAPPLLCSATAAAGCGSCAAGGRVRRCPARPRAASARIAVAGEAAAPCARASPRSSVRPAAVGHLERRFAVVDPRAQLGIGAAVEQNLNRERIALGHGHVQRRVVVDAALVRIGAERQQQPKDLVDVRPLRRARHLAGAAQRGDERRKPVIDGRVRIGADLEQRADEGERAVIDRVDEARPDRVAACGRSARPRDRRPPPARPRDRPCETRRRSARTSSPQRSVPLRLPCRAQS